MRIPPGPSRHTFSVWFILSVLIALTVSCAFAQAPVISAAPLTKLVVAGQPVSFAVGASGADLIYQWKHNGKVMSGATSSVLTIPSASLADSGYYQAVITNTGGSVSSVFYVNVAPVRSTLVQWRSTGPLSLSGFDDLAAFGTSYFLMGLKTDGTVVGGAIYPTERPAGLTSVVAIALGGTTAAALRADGTVVTWDAYNANFSKTTPFGLTNVVAIAAGNSHVVALRTDGTVVVWGTSQYGQTALPADVGRCVGIAASGHQSLALREDGTVVAWGSTDFGETAATVPAGLNNVIAVSSSNGSAALKADGTALAWGAFGTNGSIVVPAGLTNVVAVAAGGSNNLALKADGSLVSWGSAAAPVPSFSGTVYALGTWSDLNFALVSFPDPSVPIAPVNRIIDVGGTIGFSAGAVGSLPITFQWKRDGVNVVNGPHVVGANGQFLTLSNVQVADAGSYTLVATNTSGSATSAAATLTVRVPPTISTQPSAQFVNLGGTISLSVVASGPGPYTYQWRKNGGVLNDGGAVAGAQTATLVINNAQSADSAVYSVTVANPATSVTSVDAVVKVVTVPDFTARPLSRLVGLGQTVNFSVSPTGPGTITLQWKRDGQVIPGATGTSYSIASVGWADRGTYEVLATNSYGTGESVFVLHVAHAVPAQMAPVLWGGGPSAALAGVVGNFVTVATSQIHGHLLRPDGTLLSWVDPNYDNRPRVPADLKDVVAVAAGGYSLGIKSDGTPVKWSSYGYSAVPAGLGVVIGVASGGSHEVYLRANGTVHDSWSSPPVGLADVRAIAAGDRFGAAIKADGTVVVWGDWYVPTPAGVSNVTAISAGKNHIVALKLDGTVVAWGDNAEGQCAVPAGLSGVVTVTAGTAHSAALKSDGSVVTWGRSVEKQSPTPPGVAQAVGLSASATNTVALVPVQAPAIVSPPVAVVRNVGDTVTLSVVAVGAPFPSYQWKKNGVSVSNGGSVAGATTATLTITGAQKSDNANYTVVGTNPLGTVESAVAKVTLVVPPTIASTPAIRTVLLGQPIIFRVMATDAPAAAYQWSRNGQPIIGAQTAVLNLPAATLADRGWYEVSVTDAAGIVSRAGFPLTVEVTNGVLIGWGSNGFGQLTYPANNANLTAVSAGYGHGLALRQNRTVAAWGPNAYGESTVPAGLSGVVAISAGQWQSLALKSDGTVVGWGLNDRGQTQPPAGLTDVVAIAACSTYSMALKSNGTVVAWGPASAIGPPTLVTGLNNIVAIAPGFFLKSDGSVVPLGGTLPASFSRGVTAIAAGSSHVQALKLDGTVVASASYEIQGEATVPPALTGVTAIAAGDRYGAALRADGTVVNWGRDYSSPVELPNALRDVVGLSAGTEFALALFTPRAPVITTSPASRVVAVGANVTFTVVVAGSYPLSYQWFQDGLPMSSGAQAVANASGINTATLTLTNVQAADVGRYTVVVRNSYGTVTSVAATLSGPPPVADMLAVAGQPFTFTAPAPTGAATYQWRRNGLPMVGATGTTYTIGTASRGDADFYDYVVTTGSSAVVSPRSRLQVAPVAYPGKVTLDPTVHIAAERVDGWVYTAAVAPNGKFYVGGEFSSVDGRLRGRVARFNADGTLDPTFVPPLLNAPVRAIRPLAGGQVWVGGDFKDLRGAAKSFSYLARLNIDGSLDDTIPDTALSGTVRALALQSDGKLLVGGSFLGFVGSHNEAYLVRFLANGSRDFDFRAGLFTNVGGGVWSIVVDASDRIIIGGFLTHASSAVRYGVARLQRNGGVDSTFAPSPGTNSRVNQVAVQADGKVIVAGEFTTANLAPRSGIARFNADGSLDTEFVPGTGFNGSTYALVALADGKLVVGGGFTTFNGASVPPLVRLMPNGTRDSDFTAAPNDTVACLVREADGRLLLTGYFFGVGNQFRFRLARLSSEGALDESLNSLPLFPGTVNSVLPLPAGQVMVGGNFQFFGGYAVAGNLGRLNANLSVDTSFNGVGTDGPVTALAAVGDGRVAIAGDFTKVNGVARAKLARLQPNGALDLTFSPGAGPNAAPAVIAALPGGQLAVGGGFTAYDTATSVPPVVALKSDGTLDPAFNSAASVGSIHSLFVQTDGKVVVGGGTPTTGGVARLLTSGAYDTSFGVTPSLNGLTTVATEPSGKLLFGGNGLLFRTRPDGSADSGLVAPGATTVQSLLPQEDGRLIVSGSIASYWEASDTALVARLNSRGGRDDSFALYGLLAAPTGLTLLDSGRLLVRGGGTPGLAVTVALALPVISTQPASVTVAGGASTTLTIVASGAGPISYQWKRDGSDVIGATSASLSLSNLRADDTGSYAVTITNSFGSVTSAAAVVTVQVPLVITTQPQSQSVVAGTSASFGVVATGTPPLRYQWKKNGANIDGATAATYALPSVQAADVAKYSVAISSGFGSATSQVASLSTVPAGISATHAVVGAGFGPGGTLLVTNTISLGAAVDRLRWSVILPDNWSFIADGGSVGSVKPIAGATNLAEWEWTDLAVGTVTFSYSLRAPASASTGQALVAIVTVNPGGTATPFLAQPDPLNLAVRHAADTDRDGKISLFELTRVIELYNVRTGTTRTGRYAVATGPTEDGFATDVRAVGDASATLAHYHSADTNRDGRVALVELTRVIELFNTRSGTARTGAYRVSAGSEDGFAPGP